MSWDLLSLFQDLDIPPHLVANNKDLIELANVRPNNRDMLLLVDGMSVVKANRMANEVLAGEPELYCEL